VQLDAEGIKRLGAILGIWAHPDDETFSMAGLMCLAVKNGQQVACVTATKGEAGVQDPSRWPPERLGEIRAAEMAAALRCIGCNNHHWLDYPDGGCKDVPDEEASDRITTLIQTYRPDTIITFPPDGITGHDDHRAVSRWARLAAARADWPITLYYAVDTREQYDRYLRAADAKFNIYFNVSEPVVVPEASCDLLIDLPEEALDCKLQALEAMPSQTAGMFADKEFDWMHDALRQESFVLASRDITWN
jgi:LmbE family N-acetylglucosaminyl deacetylase